LEASQIPAPDAARTARLSIATVHAKPVPSRAPVLGSMIALGLANTRYWLQIAPLVRRELRRWAARAAAIGDPSLRDLARGKLRVEHFNAEVAATLATLVPEAHRRQTVEAIVAFEVLYDYLDGLTERLGERIDGQPRGVHSGQIELGEWLYGPFTTVFEPVPSANPVRPGIGPNARGFDDGGYAEELAATAREAIAGLPSRAAIAAAAQRAARRCAAAQVRVHVTPQIGVGELEHWARERSSLEGGLDWRGYVAGSVASVLSIHALIAAGAKESLGEREAEAIDRAYLSISALSTMLDSLVDYRRDVRSGEPWLAELYGGPVPLGERLSAVARRAVAETQRIPHRAHHTMTLLGVVAYYTSVPEADSELARSPFARLHRELRPVILPTLGVMHAWRLAKRLRARWVYVRRAWREELDR